MVLSMTGFGRAEASVNGREIVFEIRSVNHRYFEFNSRIPKLYGFLEDPLKKLVRERISRGKIEAYLTVRQSEGSLARVRLNDGLLESYLAALKEMIAKHGLRDDISATAVSRFPDVFIVDDAEEDADALSADVFAVVGQALDVYNEMRRTEGAKLAEDIVGRLALISGFVDRIEARAPELNREYYERLSRRIKELLESVQPDEGRLLTEAAVFSDKTNVTEEIVRLRSHIAQFGSAMKASGGEPVGKRLDFIVQEMNREINTIGSKCSDMEITGIVIDVKAEIEKIREQIQNIE
ncbi:MAG: YicC family protein [Clostridia bacterium]|nr:YicC family protein [Clostridia bacterium]